MITVYYGESVSEENAEKAAQKLGELLPEAEINVVKRRAARILLYDFSRMTRLIKSIPYDFVWDAFLLLFCDAVFVPRL